jgi:FtsH-binding integral membrane protein
MLCPYCGFQRGEVAEEELKELRRRKIRDRIYRLKMTSYVALTLLAAAFGWYMVDTSGFQHRASIGPYVLFTIGAAFYLVIRVYQFMAKATLKKIDKE